MSDFANRYTLLSGKSTTGAGDALRVGIDFPRRSFQATVTGTGALTAQVLVQMSLDKVSWFTVATIDLNGTTLASDGGVVDAPWLFVRGYVNAISGTGAAVELLMGIAR